MAETTTIQKAVTLEALGEASKLIATKAEVAKQIEEASLGGGMTFATTEEVLALFQDTTSETENV